LTPLDLPPAVQAVAAACRTAGGRAYLVGGGVRDHLLGRPGHDWDIEVYGLSSKQLERALRAVGKVSAVGKAFGVLKLRVGDLEIDVALPRRDSNTGPGHRGILAQGDPELTIEEAARRRDLTINAMLVDLESGALVDPFQGARDLAAGVLRAVDETTFLEDPLRAIRAVQFAARTGFHADAQLRELCRAAPLHELPAERIEGEWRKLMLKGVQPSIGLALARDVHIPARVFPELVDAPALDDALDRLATRRDALGAPPRAYAAMLATWLRDTPAEGREATLDRLGVHRLHGYPVRRAVLDATAQLEHPATTDKDLRWLSTKAELAVVLAIHRACRPDAADAIDRATTRATELGVLHEAPPPLLLGRHASALVPPGPELGAMLREVYARQLDGDVTDLASAMRAAADLARGS
jgi:tRNA nucleotidyltransferase (CCA-adding enzyme)